jgi:hypothetical protein
MRVNITKLSMKVDIGRVVKHLEKLFGNPEWPSRNDLSYWFHV